MGFKSAGSNFPKVKGGTHNTASYAKPIKNRAKFVTKHAGKTINQLSSSKKGL